VIVKNRLAVAIAFFLAKLVVFEILVLFWMKIWDFG